MTTSSETKRQPVCLTIAGVDPSGGAGVIADIKTFFAFGCFPTAAIASLTFQNTQGVFGSADQTGAIVRQQIEPIIDDLSVDSIKTGMLPNRDVIETVADILQSSGLRNLVVDPVVRSTSGYDLIDDSALLGLTEQLFPLSEIVTPNIPEAERISGISIESEADIIDAAAIMRDMGARNVLIKGGHFFAHDTESGKRTAKDFLFIGEELTTLSAEYYETRATHGTGCTLAAAIAASLALGKGLFEAVSIAKEFVNEAIRTAPGIGKGHSPINVRPI